MEWLTLLVALVGAVAIVALPPRRGLMVFLAITLLYPDFMRIIVGGLEVNPHRIMITLLLGMCLARQSIRERFRWNRLDTAVAAAMAVYALTLLFTMPVDKWAQNRGGDLTDTFFVYMTVRLLVTDRATLVGLVKVLGVLLVPLAVLGVCEAVWAKSPYLTLASYGTHVSQSVVYEVRHGFNRAGGPWVSSIMFGLMFASFIPLLRLLRYERRPWKGLAYILCGIAVIGLLSTMSSGPYMMLMVVTFCLLLERHKSLVRPILIVAISSCLVVEIVSNRHFYDVLADILAMDSGNAWYRSQLMRFAIQDLPNYWMVGYGFADPGWGILIDERATDGCNDYVVHAAVHGLPGLVAFIAILATAMWATVTTHARTADPWLRSYTWALGSIMVGLMLAYFTVSPFKIMITVFYILLGLQGSLLTFPAARMAPAHAAASRPRSRRLLPMPLGARASRTIS